MEIYHTKYLLSQPLKCILALVNVIVIYDRFCDRFFLSLSLSQKVSHILEFKPSIYHKKYHYHDIGIGPRIGYDTIVVIRKYFGRHRHIVQFCPKRMYEASASFRVRTVWTGQREGGDMVEDSKIHKIPKPNHPIQPPNN